MNPSIPDILNGCIQNLNELVLPELADPHALSAARCLGMLLNHVVLRLEHENAALETDSAEKRALLIELARSIELSVWDAAELQDLLGSAEPLARPLDAMTVRNDRWKRLFENILSGSIDNAVRAHMRAQLAAQIQRENNYVGPALDGPLF